MPYATQSEFSPLTTLIQEEENLALLFHFDLLRTHSLAFISRAGLWRSRRRSVGRRSQPSDCETKLQGVGKRRDQPLRYDPYGTAESKFAAELMSSSSAGRPLPCRAMLRRSVVLNQLFCLSSVTPRSKAFSTAERPFIGRRRRREAEKRTTTKRNSDRPTTSHEVNPKRRKTRDLFFNHDLLFLRVAPLKKESDCNLLNCSRNRVITIKNFLQDEEKREKKEKSFFRIYF